MVHYHPLLLQDSDTSEIYTRLKQRYCVLQRTGVPGTDASFSTVKSRERELSFSNHSGTMDLSRIAA